MKEGEGAGQPVVSTISPRRFAGDLHADPLPINSSKLATATGWYPPAPPTSATSYTFQNCPNSALNPLSRTSPSPAEGRAARDRALMPPPQVPGGGRSRSHQLTQHQSPHPCPSVSFQPSPQRQQFPIRFDDIDERAEGVREDQEEGSEYMRRELGGGEGESSGSDDEYEDKAGEHVQSAPQRRRLLEPEQMEGRGEWKLPLLERIGPAHADVEMAEVIEDMQGGKAKEEVEEIEEVQEVYYEEDREAFERQQQIEPEQVGMQVCLICLHSTLPSLTFHFRSTRGSTHKETSPLPSFTRPIRLNSLFPAFLRLLSVARPLLQSLVVSLLLTVSAPSPCNLPPRRMLSGLDTLLSRLVRRSGPQGAKVSRAMFT